MLPSPTFREALRFWAKLGWISFGGPAGQIAIMHAELVERRRWIGEERFLHALNFCLLLPGPEATQLATYCGWLLHGIRGGVAAGVLFILPSAVLLWGLSWLYVAHGQLPLVAAVFAGLKPAVAAIVAMAVVGMGRRALRGAGLWILAAMGFAALTLFRVPFPVVMLGAAAVGWGGRRWLVREPPEPAALASPAHAWSWRRAARVAGVCLTLWWAPVAAAWLWQGPDGVLMRQGIFFSQAAMVTFGGAYAVLPYVGQAAVETHGWLTAAQMLDGLGLAETTPGPLIMVLQFVGFLGGWNASPEHPLLMGTLAAAMTTWTTFVPCFLWILLGAPLVERGRQSPGLRAVFAAISATVVGVVLNLAVWFALQVFRSQDGTWNGFATAVFLAAVLALQFLRAGVIPVVFAAGAVGVVWGLLH